MLLSSASSRSEPLSDPEYKEDFAVVRSGGDGSAIREADGSAIRWAYGSRDRYGGGSHTTDARAMTLGHTERAEHPERRRTSSVSTGRITPNFFGIPFGLAGLTRTWVTLHQYHQAPAWVGNALLVLTGLSWALIVVLYGRSLRDGPHRLADDLLDQVAGPFISLALIVPMLLAAVGIYPHAPGAGRILVDVFLAASVVLGGWFIGQWIYGPIDADHLHPGYYLPTVGSGLVGAMSAAQVGQRRLAEAALGLGVISWVILGSIILARLLSRPPLPASLTPTLAIEVAPAALASLAYLAIDGDHIDTVAALLAGYGVLIVLSQLRLAPTYARLRFSVSTWAFAFSWAAVATTAIHWINELKPGGQRVYAYLVAAAITTLIGGIAARTLLAVERGQLVTGPPAQPTRTPTQAIRKAEATRVPR
jgi:tellurite resistance protein